MKRVQLQYRIVEQGRADIEGIGADGTGPESDTAATQQEAQQVAREPGAEGWISVHLDLASHAATDGSDVVPGTPGCRYEVVLSPFRPKTAIEARVRVANALGWSPFSSCSARMHTQGSIPRGDGWGGLGGGGFTLNPPSRSPNRGADDPDVSAPGLE